MVSKQQLCDFKLFLDKNQEGSVLLQDEYPPGAVMDAKDVELLNNLHKKSWRPTNYNKKLNRFFSQAKSSLIFDD